MTVLLVRAAAAQAIITFLNMHAHGVVRNLIDGLICAPAIDDDLAESIMVDQAKRGMPEQSIEGNGDDDDNGDKTIN